jgi:hypothetical protein
MKFFLCALLLCTSIAMAGTRASFNEDNVLVIDGKKIFPIAFIMPPLPDALTPDGKNGIDELHDAGATFLRTGIMGQTADWNDAAFAREQKWQDAAARNGMHCMPFLRQYGSIKPGDRESEATLRKIINTFKDHPGMGAYYGFDEPEWGQQPVEPLRRAYEIVKELDPHHPVWICQAPRGTVDTLRAYDNVYGATGMDVYPISYPPGVHSVAANKEISMVGDFTKMMMDVTAGKKPVWMCLQIAWSGVNKPGKTLRFPTFPQERFMTYQSIINGARGVIFFGGQLGTTLSPEDAKLGWNWTFWRRVLRPVIEQIGEHSPLYPALLAPQSKLPIKLEGDSAGIEYCVREVNDEIFLLACKREGATINVTFTGLPLRGTTTGEVLFESPRKIEAKDGTFTDWFAPFDVHVYRFRR